MTKEEMKKKAEDFAIIECCSTCSIKNPYSCEEKCECWTFATEGVKFGYSKANEKYIEWLGKAKEIILKLYNAGRDVLMCRAEEKAYTNLSNAINDRSIEKFLQEVSKLNLLS